MNLDKDALVALDLELVSDYGNVIPKVQIGQDLFNLIDSNFAHEF